MNGVRPRALDARDREGTALERYVAGLKNRKEVGMERFPFCQRHQLPITPRLAVGLAATEQITLAATPICRSRRVRALAAPTPR